MSGNIKERKQFNICTDDDNPIYYNVKMNDNTLIVTSRSEETDLKEVLFALTDAADEYSVDFAFRDGRYVMTAHKEKNIMFTNRDAACHWHNREMINYCRDEYRVFSSSNKDKNRKRTIFLLPFFAKNILTKEDAEKTTPVGFYVLSGKTKDRYDSRVLYVLEATKKEGRDNLDIVSFADKTNIRE